MKELKFLKPRQTLEESCEYLSHRLGSQVSLNTLLDLWASSRLEISIKLPHSFCLFNLADCKSHEMIFSNLDGGYKKVPVTFNIGLFKDLVAKGKTQRSLSLWLSDTEYLDPMTRLPIPREIVDLALPEPEALSMDMFTCRRVDLDELASDFKNLVSTSPSTSHELPRRETPSLAINLTTTERTTLYKMILGMALERYGYDPGSKRNAATGSNSGSIASDLEKHGLEVDVDTIRKHLQAAAELRT